MGRAVGPVVAPADDDVAAVGWMAVVAEVAALEFKFDEDALPARPADLPFRFAIRESVLHGLNDVAKFFCQHPEDQDNSLFVYGFVTHFAEVERVAIGGTIFSRRML